MTMHTVVDALLSPSRICSRSEFLARSCPVPKEGGIYAWYFRELPPAVPCCRVPEFKGLKLLYIGTSPATANSRNNLRRRIRADFNRNASCSTLRMTLGCLLADKLSIVVRRAGGRLTFGEGEAKLSDWMEANAYVAWVEHERPWSIEEEIIRKVSPLLNLDHNKESCFHRELSEIRRQCIANARAT